MSSISQTFCQISSLGALSLSLNTPLSDEEWGILALDLDQTLIQAQPTLGDEHFYQFLKQKNRERGVHPDAHYHWTVKVRAKVRYVTCESVGRINQILRNFRKEGWTLKILTSRGMDMREITAQHLEDSQLEFSQEDVIFKESHPDRSGKLLQKDESLIRWMEMRPEWKRCKKIRILFSDDSDKYCSEVARTSEKVDRATVTCFHYSGSPPNPILSETQMKLLAVQLNAYQESQSIPCAADESEYTRALEALGIQNMGSEELYRSIVSVAAKEGFLFT